MIHKQYTVRTVRLLVLWNADMEETDFSEDFFSVGLELPLYAKQIITLIIVPSKSLDTKVR
jgi:hypothetical protein